MQRFDPPGAGRRSPNASFGPGRAAISSRPRDDAAVAAVAAFEETGPSDGGRLLACLRSWADCDTAAAAVSDGNASRQRFHYLLRCGLGPGQLPDRQQLRERIDALEQPLPDRLATALLRGWPPPLRGLHRIELVPGRAWVSIAIGPEPSTRRRIEFGMALPAPAKAHATDTTDAIVVGAGLAGCALADSLLRRGWRVTVIEGRSEVGGVVAGVPLLAQHPALSPGADRRSRLLVAALLASARLQDRLDDAFTWCGRFQPMPIEEARMRTAGVPSSVAVAIESSMAAFHGVTGLQGIWYPQCAMADPQRWWQRLQQSPLLDLRLSTLVMDISGGPGGWQATDGDGRVIARAPVLVLANQAGAFPLARMPPVASGRLRISRQQVAIGTAVASTAVSTTAGPAEHRALPTLSGASYRIEEEGLRCVAGPIRHGEDDPLFKSLLDPALLPSAMANCAGYRWRLSAPAERLLLRDNLPMIGVAPDTDSILAARERFERNDRLPLPRREGLYLLTGLGGRGLLWSVLGAEIIAAQANGEPAVVESDLLEAVDPARFLKRTLRRARSAGDPTG